MRLAFSDVTTDRRVCGDRTANRRGLVRNTVRDLADHRAVRTPLQRHGRRSVERRDLRKPRHHRGGRRIARDNEDAG